MNITIKAPLTNEWTVTDEGIMYKGKLYKFDEISSVKVINQPLNKFINGTLDISTSSGSLVLAFPFLQKDEANEAIRFITENYGSDAVKEKNKLERAAAEERIQKENAGAVYSLTGVRGRSMNVYDDRVLIKVKVGIGSLITGNLTDGEKTIYYTDCIGVQFKESTMLIGYIQLETASAMMNNKGDNFYNENTFTFDTTVQTNEKMREVADFIRGRISEAKSSAGKPQVVMQSSGADELKKFKELLELGVITQEEFDMKKKQILGL